MVLLDDGGVPTIVKYKLSGFSGKQQAKSKIRDSCGNYKFVTAPGVQLPPKLQRYLLNTNRRQCTGFAECLCHRPPQKLLTVIVNKSTGGPGGWFGICSSVSDTPMTSETTGIFN